MILFHMSVSSFAACPLSRGNGGPRGRFRDMMSEAGRLDPLPFSALKRGTGGLGSFSSFNASHSKADTISWPALRVPRAAPVLLLCGRSPGLV